MLTFIIEKYELADKIKKENIEAMKKLVENDVTQEDNVEDEAIVHQEQKEDKYEQTDDAEQWIPLVKYIICETIGIPKFVVSFLNEIFNFPEDSVEQWTQNVQNITKKEGLDSLPLANFEQFKQEKRICISQLVCTFLSFLYLFFPFYTLCFNIITSSLSSLLFDSI